MKRYSWCLLLLVIAACTSDQKVSEHRTDSITPSKNTIEQSGKSTDTVWLSKTDTAFIIRPALGTDSMSCPEEPCRIRIRFSNQLPDLEYPQAIGADLHLAGDLNGDGQPELLLRPEWFTSCWSAINVFSLKNGAWKKITTGSMYWCSDDLPLSKRVEKTGKGFALLCDSMADADFIVTRKLITF